MLLAPVLLELMLLAPVLVVLLFLELPALVLVAPVLQANSTSAASICARKPVLAAPVLLLLELQALVLVAPLLPAKNNTNIASTSASRTGIATSNVLQAYTLRVV